jgi:hypothetical protein
MPINHDRQKDRREAQRPVEEAGGGVAEGFEMAEEELRRQAENMEDGQNPKYDAGRPELGPPMGTFGEADHEHSTECPDDDR